MVEGLTIALEVGETRPSVEIDTKSSGTETFTKRETRKNIDIGFPFFLPALLL
jgi:hypothetical protein